MSKLILSVSFLAVGFLSVVVTGVDIPISIPHHAPSTARRISPDHFSWSLEKANWLDFVGRDYRNEFFYNAISNVISLSGVPPRLHLGGESADTVVSDWGFNGVAEGYGKFEFPQGTPQNPYPVGSGRYGKAFWQRLSYLHPGTYITPVSVYFPVENSHVAMEYYAFTDALISKSVREKDIRLGGAETSRFAERLIGYPDQDDGCRGGNARCYLGSWKKWVRTMFESADPEDDPWLPADQLPPLSLWAGGFSNSTHSDDGFSPQSLIKLGLLTGDRYASPYVKTFSQGYYPGGNLCSPSNPKNVLQDMMDKTNIRRTLSPFAADAALVHQYGLEYVFGETNSFECHGAANVSNTAGAALWMLNYFLFGAQLGIDRFFFHNGVGYRFNLVQPTPLPRSPLDGTPYPTPLPPHIQPAYYANIIAAEAIGASNKTKIVEIRVDHENVSGYAIYKEDLLSCAVFINSAAFFSGDTARSKARLNLKLVVPDLGKATLKRLYVRSADSTSGLVWGGVTYETADGRPKGREEVTDLGEDGILEISATEAVLIRLN